MIKGTEEENARVIDEKYQRARASWQFVTLILRNIEIELIRAITKFHPV